ncbi:glycosyltransferase family 25 protein [Alteromonas lipolytica]|uniref:Glycosyl transferase family 25 domain-containing protein n=1 Tax=Alteromonas lipolytica TaxID=1856405 RepID=A0A1E8FBL2_9ALTE|nr:glycosyltransferase family 25 protein [Alteromonas lipolytica]OFI33299.1 hypothetical protein BFC17_03295 [Alteromonas lipolytica]GGF60867.1 hypothetical protein GCM10011338_11430 [Alteromonas lipolytica]
MTCELPPIWLINLDKCADRLVSATEQLQRAGLTAERFSAVNGKALSEEEIAACYDEQANKAFFRRPISRGEIGCYLSHRTLWQRMVDEQIEVAVIIEDDIIIDPKFGEVISKIAQVKHWDMIKLAARRGCEGDERFDLGDGYSLVNFAKVPNCTTGYAITLSGAKKLLSRRRFFRPVDVDLQFYPELNLSVFATQPYRLSANKEFDSEIDKIGGGTRKSGTTFWRNIRYRWQLWRIRKFSKSGDVDKLELQP